MSCRSVLLVKETGGPGENHRPVASHWQTLSHNVVHPPWSGFELTTSVVICTDCIGSCSPTTIRSRRPLTDTGVCVPFGCIYESYFHVVDGTGDADIFDAFCWTANKTNKRSHLKSLNTQIVRHICWWKSRSWLRTGTKMWRGYKRLIIPQTFSLALQWQYRYTQSTKRDT